MFTQGFVDPGPEYFSGCWSVENCKKVKVGLTFPFLLGILQSSTLQPFTSSSTSTQHPLLQGLPVWFHMKQVSRQNFFSLCSIFPFCLVQTVWSHTTGTALVHTPWHKAGPGVILLYVYFYENWSKSHRSCPTRSRCPGITAGSCHWQRPPRPNGLHAGKLRSFPPTWLSF